MNRITDIVIATQLSTCMAAFCTFMAHLIDNGSILNANWHFAVYVLLAIATVFMLFPHLVSHKAEARTNADLLNSVYGYEKYPDATYRYNSEREHY